ncbi:hypothetical protein IIC38_19350 [candidate division KSB1 bacterium]|nr:hypothetical protein [candidate division KSB1 bacterium]
MKTVDLAKEKLSIDKILSLAKLDAVIIQGTDGVQYILEEADEFEKEVATLGKNEQSIII